MSGNLPRGGAKSVSRRGEEANEKRAGDVQLEVGPPAAAAELVGGTVVMWRHRSGRAMEELVRPEPRCWRLLTTDAEIRAATERMLEREEESAMRAARRVSRRRRTLEQLSGQDGDLHSGTVVPLLNEPARTPSPGSVPSGPGAA